MFKLTNQYIEFTQFKKGTIQNNCAFFNRIEVLITKDLQDLESQIGIYVYDKQGMPFELLTGEKLYIRSLKKEDSCVITEMVTPTMTNTDPVLTATAIDTINQMRVELNTMREIYPIGITVSRNESLPSSELTTKRIKEHMN